MVPVMIDSSLSRTHVASLRVSPAASAEIVGKSSLDSLHHGELSAPTGDCYRVLAPRRIILARVLYSSVDIDRGISRVR